MPQRALDPCSRRDLLGVAAATAATVAAAALHHPYAAAARRLAAAPPPAHHVVTVPSARLGSAATDSARRAPREPGT